METESCYCFCHCLYKSNRREVVTSRNFEIKAKVFKAQGVLISALNKKLDLLVVEHVLGWHRQSPTNVLNTIYAYK